MSIGSASGELRQRAFRLVLQSRRQEMTEQSSWLDARLRSEPELSEEVRLLLDIDRRKLAVLDRPQAPDDELPVDSRVGARVGRFSILAKIASGGMGVVYRALPDWEGAQPVALKLIKRGLDSRVVHQRFLRERSILAGLKHTNIAQLIDAGVGDDGQPWFAMELVDGMPIHLYCNQHALSLRQRVMLMQQVIAAVAAAHQRLVIHRDIKASNVLVTASGTVKLLDFGIAKLLDDDKRNITDTVPSDSALTIDSAAPEQLRRERAGTPTDVFQLGLLLLQLLLGVTSQRSDDGRAETLSAALRRVQSTAPQALQKLAADRGMRVERWQLELRGDLDRIVAKAIHWEPARRYATALALSDDLSRWLNNEPVMAAPDSWRYRAAKLLQRHRQAAITTAVVVLSIMLAAGWAIERTIQAERETRRAQAAEKDALASEARAQASRKTAEETRQLFIDALVAVDPASGLGPNPTRQQTFAFAAKRAEERLKSDTPALVDVLDTIASAQVTLDDEKAASALFERILTLAHDRPELDGYRGTALMRLGYFANAHGDADALQKIDAGIELLQHASPRMPQLLSEALRVKIGILFNAGKLATLPELSEQATRAAAEDGGEASIEYAVALTQRATILAQIDGRREEALVLARRAVQIAQNDADGNDQAAVVVARSNLAEILAADGRVREALPIVKKNVEVDTQLLGATHQTVLYMLYKQANVEADLGLFDDSAQHYRQSLGDRPEQLMPIARAAESAGLAAALTGLDDVAAAAGALNAALEMCTLRGEASDSCVRVRFLAARTAYASRRNAMLQTQLNALRKLDDPKPALATLAIVLFETVPANAADLDALKQSIDALGNGNVEITAYARLRAAESAYRLQADAFGDDQLSRAKTLLDERWDGHPPLRENIAACIADRHACAADRPRRIKTI